MERVERGPARGWLNKAGPVAAYLALCFIWGSTYLAIRLAVQTMPPLLMVGARSVIAGTILAALALATGAAWPDRRALLRAGASGALLFLGGQVCWPMASSGCRAARPRCWARCWPCSCRWRVGH